MVILTTFCLIVPHLGICYIGVLNLSTEDLKEIELLTSQVNIWGKVALKCLADAYAFKRGRLADWVRFRRSNSSSGTTVTR